MRSLPLLLIVVGIALAGCTTDTGSAPIEDEGKTSDGGAPSPPGEDAPGTAFPPSVRLERVLSGLSSPLLVTHAGDGSGRLFVVEQAGVVRVAVDGALASQPYLDIRDRVSSGGERGLLGLAFAPDFAASGRLFVSYTDASGDSVLERFTVDDPPRGRPNADAGVVVLTQDQPYGNHNGGHVAFGPDGDLYLGFGDGGSGGDPHGNAQRLDTWLGKLLRLDVSGASYEAPVDNPFFGREGRDEIWAYGLRNPWRFSFDRGTGDLFIGDVGQSAWEEIDRQPAASPGGENYGWNRYEGSHAYEDADSRTGLTFPIIEYARTGGHCSVTGGYVYRGEGVPDLVGRYVYGDYCSGTVWVARATDDGWEARVLLDTDHRISSFGEDEAGELYVVDHGGAVYRLLET